MTDQELIELIQEVEQAKEDIADTVFPLAKAAIAERALFGLSEIVIELARREVKTSG